MCAEGRLGTLLLLLLLLKSGHLPRSEVRRQSRGGVQQATGRRYLKTRETLHGLDQPLSVWQRVACVVAAPGYRLCRSSSRRRLLQ
jgi:hypothetical protein